MPGIGHDRARVLYNEAVGLHGESPLTQELRCTGFHGPAATKQISLKPSMHLLTTLAMPARMTHQNG
jgi:hypothetical protein